MFLTGVDWSGDPGADSYGPGNPGYLCFAFASIDGDELVALSDALATVRARHGLVETYVFKHSGSSDRLRSDFLEAIENISLQVRVVLVDKSRDWPREFWHFTGNERLASCVAGGAGRLPTELVDGHTLLLDLKQKKDGKFCTTNSHNCDGSSCLGENKRLAARQHLCCPAPLQGHLRDELKRRTVFYYPDSSRTHPRLPIQRSRQACSSETGIIHSARE